MSRTVKAWHFLPQDGRLRYGSNELVEVGKVLRVRSPLQMCRRGLHASLRLIDALQYAPGPIVCRVECGGEIEKDTNKLVAETRKVLWMYDASAVLHEFACRCAEDALALIEKPDPRSVAAIAVKRLWLAGKATDEVLAAAGAAARDAAWDAAWGTAGDAAGDAAWDAAGAAARAAAGGAARDAAWDAAGAAARAAAGDAARAAQNRRLTAMITRSRP